MRGTATDEIAKADERTSAPWLVLLLLALVYGLSGADRQLIAVLAEPIRKDLNLSDGQIGMLSGLMFALFYTGFGIPIAWLADRYNRVQIIAGACFLWSCFTGLSGLAGNYLQLALARIGVAVGEAGGSPPSYSLIADHFPPHRRGTVLGIYSIGLPLGIAVGTAFGGWVGSHWGWRAAFYAMSVPGLVLTLLLLLLVRHPRRGRLDPTDSPETAPPLRQALVSFFRRPLLWMTTVAGALSAMASYAVMAWLPAFLMRGKGMALTDVAGIFSLVSGIAMVTGMYASGWLTDVLGKRSRRASALVPAAAYLLCAPFVAAGIWVGDWRWCIALFALPLGLMMMWLPPALATLQNNVGAGERALTAAIFLLLAGIVGNGGGPAIVGLLSDLFARTDPAHSLHWALTAMIPVFLVAATAHFITAMMLGRPRPVTDT